MLIRFFQIETIFSLSKVESLPKVLRQDVLCLLFEALPASTTRIHADDDASGREGRETACQTTLHGRLPGQKGQWSGGPLVDIGEVQPDEYHQAATPLLSAAC